MAGVLVLAAGVPSALNTYDFTVITFGYVLMRIAMVLQWLRAAREDPVGRPAAVRYAIGVGVVQVGWLVRLALPHPLDYVGFAVLVVGELAVPVWAEFRGGATTWHREHIAERYGLFSIIVLGEVILASTTAVETGLSEHGVSASLLLIAIGGLLLVFAMWWIYFTGRRPELARLPTALVWGYGHYAVFAAVAALGAGLEVAIETAEHRTEVSPVTAALAVALPVAVFLVVVASLHRLARTGADRQLLLGGSGAVAVLVLAGAAPLVGLGGAVLLMGVVLAGMVGVNLVLAKPG
jgi:low temperature requirement protein LtrA